MAEQSPISLQTNQASVGLATDLATDNLQKGQYTDCLNGNVFSYDGQGFKVGNDAGDTFCFIVPQGYKVIGQYNITQLSRVLYFLTNPVAGSSLISYVDNNNCQLIPFLDDSVTGSDLLNFSILHPIHKVVVKTTNCSTQVYWTDRYNHRRFIDFQNPPFFPGTTAIDTNRMDVQPQFSIPTIGLGDITVGGNLIEGDYQFAIQYADVRGEGLTHFYSVTNPVRVFFGATRVGVVYQELTNKAIPLDITELDTTGLYSYFNLAVVKTIQSNTTAEYVGTFPILRSTYQHTYTGLEQSGVNTPLTVADIMQQFEYYDIAGTLTTVDNAIAWADLQKEEDISFQKIFNQVNVSWGTSQVPEGQPGQLIGYHDGSVCAQYEGYQRDEVYALEGCLLFDNGKQSARFHIPGRTATSFDLQSVGTNGDINAIDVGTCPTPVLPRWKVYNTASVTGNLPGSADPCTGIRPWQYGPMSYWESTETYPSNAAVWGPLANQPIRHHCFPDSSVTHIHDSAGNVYPIGFVIDVPSLYNAIQTSPDLTAAQKRSIVGFKIMRSDRGANRRILAKGWLSNCGMYTKDNTSFYYPNYPFNDVNPDPFISQNPVDNKTGDQGSANWLQDFQRSRFTFHSPDTHFYQTGGIQGSFLKLETAEYGECTSHFIQVKDNAGEKIRTIKALEIAMAGGVASVIGFQNTLSFAVPPSDSVSITFNAQNFFPTYNAILEIIDKLSPWYNYGWQYNGVGDYQNFTVIPDDVGNKIRYIENGGYITSGFNGTFGDNHQINNTNRESSVYLHVNENFPFTHEQVNTAGINLGIPVDNSRVTASQLGLCGKSVPFNRDISSYYGSIKRDLPDQYGQIFSYQVVDTGTQAKFLDDKGVPITSIPIVYGGDTFINPFALKIKHPFYLKSTVNKGDGYDIDYNQDLQSHTNTGNVGYPIWYYSTTNLTFNLNNTALINAVNQFLFWFPNPLNLLVGGLPTIGSAINVLFQMLNSGLLTILGLKITNLDCPPNLANDVGLYETGEAYLYAYGIINFYCESEVNVDMRQAYNTKEGDFYPNVGTGIPDDWLQETNVPIVYDNTYTYNKTFSKQNHETAFTTLRPDWEPGQVCFINFNNRTIWSDQSSLEETKNNWLVYRPANMEDLSKDYGKLVAMDTLYNREVLVRYENRSRIYNAQATINTTAIQASLGTGRLFSGTQPLDLSNTDTGQFGSQNRFMLLTEEGAVYIDAKRGQVCLLRGHQVEDLGAPKYLNSRWFSNNLPFSILKDFPTIDTDNNWNGIGLHAVYDNYYKRLIITKIDYKLLPGKELQFDGQVFYTTKTYTESVPGPVTCCPDGYIYYPPLDNCRDIADRLPNVPTIPCEGTTQQVEQRLPVQVGDPNYFCDQGWTMSFSFITNSWTTWHSFIPNFYIPYEDYFQAGYNGGNFTNIWDHNNTFSTFCTYRGVQYPYILEYPFISQSADNLVQSVQDYCTAYLYSSFNQFTEPDETIYFNKVIVYNDQQCTGTRVLVPKDLSNRAQYRQYPKYNTNSVEILVTPDKELYNFNMLWDIVQDLTKPIWLDNCGTTLGRKVLNDINMVYTNQSYKKYPIRGRWAKVRLILDNQFQYKLVSRFILTEDQQMF